MRQLLLLALVTALALAQSASDLVRPEIRRVGDRLACLCGACKNTVATCQMLGCHYAQPAREKIAEMQKAGKSDEEIVAYFVQREGKRALAVPPTEGFDLLSWVMPFVAIGLGLAALTLYIRRFRKPAPVEELDASTVTRYQEQIDKEFSKLE
jgi:cytochrome c-type biogenesis protein CcmH